MAGPRLRRGLVNTWGRGALFVLASACHGGDASQRPPKAETSVASSAGSGVAAMAGEGGVADTRDPLLAGIPAMSVVLDDPRLSAARERDLAGDEAAAAREVERVQAEAKLDEAQASAWSYVVGRLHLAAGENTDAAAAFDRAAHPAADAGIPAPLVPYAALREAEALVRAGRHDDALLLVRTLAPDFIAHDEAQLLVFDALTAKGDRPAALAAARSCLASRPHGVRWADLSLQVAAALLDGVDGPPDTHAEEALEMATRVLVEVPMLAERGDGTSPASAGRGLRQDVMGLRQRAAQAAHVPLPPLTLEERARQAQAFLDASKPKRAAEVAQALLRTVANSDTKHREEACKAATVAAQATPHGKAEATAKAWGVAIERCDSTPSASQEHGRDTGMGDALATALYNGAKASANAHEPDQAMERFARVEKLFPHHRLADDARFRAGVLALEGGDEAKYESFLESLPDAYPDGDMKTEALFRLALLKLGKHDTDAARGQLDRLLALPCVDHTPAEAGACHPSGGDHAWAVAGRAAYFRARVAQLLGQTDDAKARYAAVLADEPLAYYMLLAYARLRAMDEPAAKAAIDTAVAREVAGPFLTKQHAEFASPAFDRFARLLEVGEIDAARKEASAGGLTADSVDPEVLWTLGWMYDAAGAPELGHAFSRSRLLEYRTHYPMGRWKFAWQVAFPRPWEPVVARESESSGIPSPLTWAIMREESAFEPGAHSPASAVGLMQLMAGTARLIARGTSMPTDETALERPEVSIALGARLLGSLRASFSSNPALAIAAYNGGAGAVRRWLAERGGDDFDVFVERIPFDETRAYIKRVLASEATYAFLYAPKVLEEVFTLPLRASGQEMVAAP